MPDNTSSYIPSTTSSAFATTPILHSSLIDDTPNLFVIPSINIEDFQPEFPSPFNPSASNPWQPFQQIAISSKDQALQRKFYAELSKIQLESCPRCHEKWFNMKLENGICSKCHSKDDKKAENEPFYFSAANELDFGLVPTYLPELSFTEQMMISKVHNFTQIRQIRGAQYRYKGHCVSSSRNVARVIFFSFSVLFSSKIINIFLGLPTTSFAS